LSTDSIRIETAFPTGLDAGGDGSLFKPGHGKREWFADLAGGPEFVVVPAGKFAMGSAASEPERGASEGPVHTVTFAGPFAVGRHAITRAQFATFVEATGHKADAGAYIWTASRWRFDPHACWRNPGFAQDDDHPVVCINWNDAKAYAAWLSLRAGETYGLMSEAEWEYAARAGTSTTFWWGSTISPEMANYDGNHAYQGGGATGEWRRGTVAADSFEANPWGIYQMLGNCWEWTEDCWNENYVGAPGDGSARTSGNCTVRVVRGGSWFAVPQGLRCATRYSYITGGRYSLQGFRLRRSLAIGERS